MQQKILKRHSKNQVLMLSYSKNQPIRIQKTKQVAKEILVGSICCLVNQYRPKIPHYFLNLVEKHFHKNCKFQSIFNRNNVKVSYSCTKNIKSIITNHNKTILNESEISNKKNANAFIKTYAH